MSKQFTVITKDGSKWLRPVLNPSDTDQLSRFFQNAGDGFEDLPYIGSHPEGTTVDESEVREVRQWRNKNISSLIWRDITDGKYDKWAFVNNTDHLEARIAYTDAESHGNSPEKAENEAISARKSHDRHARPFKVHNVRPLVNQLVGEEISFSRFIERLNEIANTH